MTVSEKLSEERARLLNRSIYSAQWSPRVRKRLRVANVRTFGDLMNRSTRELRTLGFDWSDFYEINVVLGHRRLPGFFDIEHEQSELSGKPIHAGKQSCAEMGVKKSVPPRLGEYLLYLVLPPKDRECVPGDLAEEYSTIILPKFGRRKAKLWFWQQVVTSIWPILSPRLKRLARFAVVAKLAEGILKWIRS